MVNCSRRCTVCTVPIPPPPPPLWSMIGWLPRLLVSLSRFTENYSLCVFGPYTEPKIHFLPLLKDRVRRKFSSVSSSEKSISFLNRIAQGWEFPLGFSEQISHFWQKKWVNIELFAQKTSDSLIHSFLVSDLSNSLTSLVFGERSLKKRKWANCSV